MGFLSGYSRSVPIMSRLYADVSGCDSTQIKKSQLDFGPLGDFNLILLSISSHFSEEMELPLLHPNSLRAVKIPQIKVTCYRLLSLGANATTSSNSRDMVDDDDLYVFQSWSNSMSTDVVDDDDLYVFQSWSDSMSMDVVDDDDPCFFFILV